MPDRMTVILKSFPAPTPFSPRPPCRPSGFLTSTGFPQRLENLENESGHFMEKSWNIINWPKVMEFSDQSWNCAPELYQFFFLSLLRNKSRKFTFSDVFCKTLLLSLYKTALVHLGAGIVIFH